MALHGTYLEVTPPSRLVWTNEEAGGSGQVTAVTFEEKAGKTLLVMYDLYPSKAAPDEATPPEARAATWTRRSTNSTSLLPPRARARDGREAVDLATGQLRGSSYLVGHKRA
jgi:uncharacterized protein YndB with AHSA1/START domain